MQKLIGILIATLGLILTKNTEPRKVLGTVNLRVQSEDAYTPFLQLIQIACHREVG